MGKRCRWRYAGGMKLHSYFRSSAAYRVRIALHLKGLSFDYVPVHLLRGDHRAAEYADRVGDALVPALELDAGQLLTQSMAIIEYLEETQPAVALLPADPLGRAHVRALAQMVACEIHPLNNLRVLKYLVRTLEVSEEEKTAWYRHWACWPRSATPLAWPSPAIAGATRRAWPIAASFPRSSTPSASA